MWWAKCERRGWSARGLALGAASLLAVGAAACSDEADTFQRSGAGKRAADAHAGKWLDLKSSVTPAQWVVSWRSDTARPQSDPDVEKARRHLEAAHALYRESERMIANRAVQLEQMLEELSVKDSAANILEDLSKIAGEVGQTEGFGAVSQHYYILRSGAYDRTRALDLLRSRYGTRKSAAPPPTTP